MSEAGYPNYFPERKCIKHGVLFKTHFSQRLDIIAPSAFGWSFHNYVIEPQNPWVSIKGAFT